MSATTDQTGGERDGAARDSADLAQFGYRQELKRSLGTFSSFAVAFSYISPSTGIFTLFSLGLITVGGAFIWTWPIVAAGQFIIALNFAEVSSHYPIAGSVFQWTKYLAGRQLRLVLRLDLPVRRHSDRDGRGLDAAAGADPCPEGPRLEEPAADVAHRARVRAITLAVITVLNIYGVRLVADHQQHRGAVRDPRHVRVRADLDDLPQPPGRRGDQQDRRPAHHVPSAETTRS